MGRGFSTRGFSTLGFSTSGFSSWEAIVFLFLSAVLLATLAGYSLQEFKTVRSLFGTIWADRLLDNLEFKDIPLNSERERVLTVPEGLHDMELVSSGENWKLLGEFREKKISKELSIKPVFDPANLLEIPGRHRVIVYRERESVLIRKI